MAETLFERRAVAQEHYRRGLELKESGMMDEAILEFRQSVQEDPAYFDPMLELLLEQEGEEASAAAGAPSQEILRRADQKYKLGMALLKHGKPEKALKHLEAACKVENTNARYHCGYAEALMAAGQHDEAGEVLRYAAVANGGSDPRAYRSRANMLIGTAYLEVGNRRRARRRLVAAYKLDAQNADLPPLLRQARVSFFMRTFVLPKYKKIKRKSNAP